MIAMIPTSVIHKISGVFGKTFEGSVQLGFLHFRGGSKNLFSQLQMCLLPGVVRSSMIEVKRLPVLVCAVVSHSALDHLDRGDDYTLMLLVFK